MNKRPKRVLLKDSLDAARSRGVRRAKAALGPDARCVVCGWRLPVSDVNSARKRVRGLHGHHVIPVCEGGPKDESNVVVLCPNHHTVAHALGDLPYRKWRKVERASDSHRRLVRWLRMADKSPDQLSATIRASYPGAEYRKPTEVIPIAHHSTMLLLRRAR